jgi:hypothetical protein
MGLFKKIGDAVKKGVKQISLKNIVKLGTPLLSAIPVVGGVAQNVVENLSAAHEAQKQANDAVQAGEAEKAKALQQQADYLASLSGAQVGQQAGSVLNAFSKGVATEAKAQLTTGAKEAIGITGAGIVDNTITEWFKLHWGIIVLAVGGVIGAIFFWNKGSKTTTKKYRK